MLLPPMDILEKIPRLYEDEDTPLEQKMIWVHYYSPYNGWHWYVTEYDPDTRIFFGLVHGYFEEWGSFSLDEFEEINRDKPGAIVLDNDWVPKTVREAGLA